MSKRDWIIYIATAFTTSLVFNLFKDWLKWRRKQRSKEYDELGI